MIPEKYNDLFESGRDHFENNEYPQAEEIFNQLILNNVKEPLLFHMLGTIYYDQGKFNKAIRSFRRALETDPSFTDASVGLSIILNDLGRYEEGKKVFEEAKVMLEQQNHDGDPYVEEKIAIKHDELGELYFQYKKFPEALEQFARALELSNRKAEITMKLVECHLRLENVNAACNILKTLLKDYPDFHSARLKLGKLYYDAHQITEAISQWETILRAQPDNQQANDYLRLAQSIDVISLNDQPTV